jgi:hypothetical protein
LSDSPFKVKTSDFHTQSSGCRGALGPTRHTSSITSASSMSHKNNVFSQTVPLNLCFSYGILVVLELWGLHGTLPLPDFHLHRIIKNAFLWTVSLSLCFPHRVLAVVELWGLHGTLPLPALHFHCLIKIMSFVRQSL